MTWKKSILGTCLALALLLTFVAVASADTAGNLDQFTQAKLAETQRINAGCQKCHNQKQSDSTGQVSGQAPYIDPTAFGKSIHGTIPCTACHADVQAGSKPANILSQRDLEKQVNQYCEKCHTQEAKAWEKSTHGQLFQEGKETALCTDCHGSHNILKVTDKASAVTGLNSVETCEKCHDKQYKETYAESFHGRSIHLGGTQAATCVSCHGSHLILGPEDPKSTVNKANLAKTCAKCHLNPSPGFARGTEHAEIKAQGPGAITYWTLKFFTWLTIITFTLLIIHMEIELYRRIQRLKKR